MKIGMRRGTRITMRVMRTRLEQNEMRVRMMMR